jgi:predicted GNAT family acetyltransferase
LSLVALDRPVWSSLTGRQRHLAIDGGAAVRIAIGCGPFVAARDASDEAQRDLARLVAEHGPCAPIEPEPWPAPPGCHVAEQLELVQMIADNGIVPGAAVPDIAPLGESDVADMAALAALTEPRPWEARTHEIGPFLGVRREGRLIAMTGERMLPGPGFAEVSAVCTHPGARGQGLAAALVRAVAARMAARGEVPFLHVLSSNTGAIRVYEALGFRKRRMMVATILVAD